MVCRSLNSLFLNDIFLLDIGELRKMWNSIEFTDYDSEREEEDDDDDQEGKSSQRDRSTLIRNSTSLTQMVKNTVHLSQERVGLPEFLHHWKSQLQTCPIPM